MNDGCKRMVKDNKKNTNQINNEAFAT